ncbi:MULTISPECIES: ribonuclease III [Pigmentiphaga]|uniref:Ribonuclease 3 n=1 Tax=Pigmentiphaga daeguensis TaxID=414049 RepID=A0ABP3MNL9_9BURK|nr:MULTISPECIES: ribonuclease III [unclassified Pigmentiphaga]OVZ60888.1 ribonuclease III [Pigmentiphaga sp. NML030171]
MNIETSLAYTFRNKSLLEQALTHRSHSSKHNERLEFLGDSVLNCAIASLLYDRFARIDEGDLSRLRANLVKQASLADIAQRVELSRFLRLGEGELKSGGFRRPSILADTLEAIFGAIFMDGGFDAASAVIARLYKPVLETVDPKTLGKDAKTLLQEYLQGRKIALPVYTVVATHGAAHSQEFEVECAIPKLDVQVVGIGGSRRAAEQAAAKQALEAALAANPTPAKRSPRARKTAQLSLPVAVAQEVPDEPANAAKVEAAAVSAPARAAVIEAPVAKITSTQAAEGKAPVPAAAPRKEPQAAPPAPQPPGETLSASGQPAGKK